MQGFLNKLGLTRSYTLLNAFAYALRPSRAQSATRILSEPAHLAWRNTLLDAVTGPDLQAVVAFGYQAQAAVEQWQPPAGVPVIEVPHPSSRNAGQLLDQWRNAVDQLRQIVTPDPDGDPTGANYDTRFDEADYTRIPAHDLPFGLPAWFGDDSWGRTARPRHNNSVERLPSDLLHTLVWTSPADQP